MHEKPIAYGIDFGTTNSLMVGVFPNKHPEKIPLDQHNSDPLILKSIWFSAEKDSFYYGQAALDKMTEFAGDGRVLRSIKKFLPDSLFEGTKLFNKHFSIIDLIGLFLKNMKNIGDSYYETDCTTLILGRPARFHTDEKSDELAQQRLYQAAKVAGFKDIRFCPEPVACAFDFKNELSSKKNVLIADFGGGTSDFTLVKMDQTGFNKEDILGTHGINLAGDAFDSSIMANQLNKNFGADVEYKLPTGGNTLSLPKHLIMKMNSPADICLLGRKETKEILNLVKRFSSSNEMKRKLDQLFLVAEENLGYGVFSAIEKAKKALSSALEAQVIYQEFGIDIDETLKAENFLAYSDSISDSIIKALEETVMQSGLKYKDIDIVCLTGGTAKIARIQKALADRFGAEKLSQFRNFHSVINGLGEFGRIELTTT